MTVGASGWHKSPFQSLRKTYLMSETAFSACKRSLATKRAGSRRPTLRRLWANQRTGESSQENWHMDLWTGASYSWRVRRVRSQHTCVLWKGNTGNMLENWNFKFSYFLGINLNLSIFFWVNLQNPHGIVFNTLSLRLFNFAGKIKRNHSIIFTDFRIISKDFSFEIMIIFGTGF